MSEQGYKNWRVVQSVELGATADQVWDVIGGFYTIHEWHPDIERTDVPEQQTGTRELRRALTFPGESYYTEELVSLDNENHHYRYKYHTGEWGQRIQNYYSDLSVFDTRDGKSVVQWVAHFYFNADGISDFYLNGLHALQKRFPLN